MGIPNWIIKVADTKVDNLFPEDEYKNLLQKYDQGNLSGEEADALEEIAYLLHIIKTAVSKLVSPIKEAAAPESTPSKEVVPPATLPKVLPDRKVLPGKTPEPSSTKWKEIRYNKRDGKWQIITSIRTVRNFNSEEEALEFGKKI